MSFTDSSSSSQKAILGAVVMGKETQSEEKMTKRQTVKMNIGHFC